MDRVDKYTQMESSMKESGKMTRGMAKGNKFMQMEVNMKESGRMIKLMGEELTLMPMALAIQVNGKTISNMGLEWRRGQIMQSMKVTITKERRMVKES